MSPCRVVDTRNPPGPLAGPALTAGFPVRTFPILASACGIPLIAQAYSFNVTAVPPAALFFLTVGPSIPCCAIPGFSTLNDATGLVLANAAIVPAGPGGAVDVYASNPTHLVIDINGYFAAPTDNTTLNGNTALGYQSLFSMSTVTPGVQNTAVGWAAGHNNMVGSQNTFLGNGAGYSNDQAFFNTFTGTEAGYFKQVGDFNAFYGYRAGYRNYTGKFNTYLGTSAGHYNDGSGNTFVGFDAGWNPCGIGCVGNGSDNTFVGWEAGFYNISGNHNTYIGENAGNGVGVTGGSYNTFLGDSAGINGSGSSNLYVVNAGVAGGENNTIRIGTQGIGNGQQNNAYMAGIFNVLIPNGIPVVIDNTGHLGTVAPSSRRYKDDIEDMAQASSGLLRLRPVTFHYKEPRSAESSTIEYGLIAEEVAAIYPNLVARATNGQIETVLYHKLTPMLLNELQRQDVQLHRQAETIQRQQEQNRDLEGRVAALEALLSANGARRQR